MAKVHVLDQQSPGRYRCVLHFAVPAGNNSAGITWKNALLRAFGTPATILPDGDGTGGTISATEKASVVAGDVVERVVTIEAETGGTSAAAMGATVDAEAARLISEEQTRLGAQLKWFGVVRN